MIDIKLREALANLEHQQWLQWSKTLMSELDRIQVLLEKGPENIEEATDSINNIRVRWLKNWKPYTELDEATKEFNRSWADLIMKQIECQKGKD